MSINLFPLRTIRSAVSIEGLDPAALEAQSEISDIANRTGARGVGGGGILEPVPGFLSSDSERVISNENNSYIVLGRDRPGSRMSGYGGRGETQCGSIDIVCGRMGADPRQTNENGEFVHVNPNFRLDAARIYISQKTDIDENFGLAGGRVGSTTTKSGIALKADGIRVIARDGIKLITRTDRRNSQGGEVQSIAGIDLIAGNDDTDLQPMVKGNSLVAAFEQLVSQVDALNGIVDSFLMSQMELNSFITSHFHISPFFGIPNVPSPVIVPSGISTAVRQLVQTKASLVTHKANLVTYKLNYFNPAGNSYINSRYNHTN
tara:strand:+ start:260 stop:1216 length:957 start_codon:yes stop_codon:yes gene_type:complete